VTTTPMRYDRVKIDIEVTRSEENRVV